MTGGGSPGSEESELRSATSFFARRHRRHTPRVKWLTSQRSLIPRSPVSMWDARHGDFFFGVGQFQFSQDRPYSTPRAVEAFRADAPAIIPIQSAS
jgi:hypothetical protein